jgi:hypothetical protein
MTTVNQVVANMFFAFLQYYSGQHNTGVVDTGEGAFVRLYHEVNVVDNIPPDGDGNGIATRTDGHAVTEDYCEGMEKKSDISAEAEITLLEADEGAHMNHIARDLVKIFAAALSQALKFGRVRGIRTSVTSPDASVLKWIAGLQKRMRQVLPKLRDSKAQRVTERLRMRICEELKSIAEQAGGKGRRYTAFIDYCSNVARSMLSLVLQNRKNPRFFSFIYFYDSYSLSKAASFIRPVHFNPFSVVMTIKQHKKGEFAQSNFVYQRKMEEDYDNNLRLKANSTVVPPDDPIPKAVGDAIMGDDSGAGDILSANDGDEARDDDGNSEGSGVGSDDENREDDDDSQGESDGDGDGIR